MIETAFVFDLCGNVIFWHTPENRSGGSIPDSLTLWNVLWENRENLGGVAHTHPFHGGARPSHTDVTTFAACEAALGRRLLWPIITLDETAIFRWHGPGKFDYKHIPRLKNKDIEDLKALSIFKEKDDVRSENGKA